MKSKNICLLIYDLSAGGAERVICKWSELLSIQYNVHLIVFRDEVNSPYDHAGKYVCLNVPSDNSSYASKVKTVLHRAYKLKKYVDSNDIDIVISFCNECNLVNTFSMHHAKKVCSVRSFHDLDANKYVSFSLKNKNNKIFVQTERLKDFISQSYKGNIAKRTYVIGNPFDKTKIEEMSKEEPPSMLRDILARYRTIVNVASYKTEKNHADLLRSFEMVCEKIDHVFLILIGADNGLESELKGMISKSKYKDRIIMMGELKNPFSVVSRATVFCLTSFTEGIPNRSEERRVGKECS